MARAARRSKSGAIIPPYKRPAEETSLSAVSEPPARIEAALAAFEEAVGGRDALIDSLAHAPDDPATKHILGLIADPRNYGKSLARVCTAARISFSQLLDMFRQAGLAKAQIAAMQKVWKKIPEVAEDLMERAAPYRRECIRCFGEKLEPRDPEHPVEEACKLCKGEGTLLHYPDLERQKVALEVGGLLKRSAGVQVQLNQQLSGGADFMQGFRAASDKLLFPREEEALDAELVEEPSEDVRS